MINEMAAALFALALAAPPMLFPNRSIEFYAIIILSAVIIYLIFWCFRIHQEKRKLENKLGELLEKHQALSSQFDLKRNELNRYRAGFRSIEYMLASVMTSSRKERFSAFYQWFLDFKEKVHND